MLDRGEFAKLLSALFIAKGKDIPGKEALNVWYEIFKNEELDDFKRGVDTLAKTSTPGLQTSHLWEAIHPPANYKAMAEELWDQMIDDISHGRKVDPETRKMVHDAEYNKARFSPNEFEQNQARRDFVSRFVARKQAGIPLEVARKPKLEAYEGKAQNLIDGVVKNLAAPKGDA